MKSGNLLNEFDPPDRFSTLKLSLHPISQMQKWNAQSFEYNRNDITPKHLMSERFTAWHTNMNQMTVAQAQAKFEMAHSFKALKDGKTSALAVWFNTWFPGGKELTNAPEAADTHWGRTIFPFDQVYSIKKGDSIDVAFTCEPAGPGFCRGGWSVRVGGGAWERHLDHLNR